MPVQSAVAACSPHPNPLRVLALNFLERDVWELAIGWVGTLGGGGRGYSHSFNENFKRYRYLATEREIMFTL